MIFVLQQQDLIKYYSERADYFGDNQPVLYGVVATIKGDMKLWV